MHMHHLCTACHKIQAICVTYAECPNSYLDNYWLLLVVAVHMKKKKKKRKSKAFEDLWSKLLWQIYFRPQFRAKAGPFLWKKFAFFNYQRFQLSWQRRTLSSFCHFKVSITQFLINFTTLETFS